MAHPRAVLPLLLLAALSCSDAVAPLPLPDGAVRFTPDPIYREWWAQVEDCAGSTGDFDAVEWYVVPGDRAFYAPGLDRKVLGYWDPGSNRIVVLEWVPSASALVRHEMLHAILRETGHPAEYFERRCGPVISGPGLPAPH